ncbi:hypothetical protein ACFFX1_34490 [Dactylosporangium sucinum]|uniref:Secreted protein n=1 Tax=Dactylosporangium sucinum TaxID=1424081 RepID=A0A917U1M7_9ACTN|nr:hypothetical protein [Dactylosporangium sucinum]GGM51131.1 hypothetical protein GCM10007977_061170 [Dactylosporangium sucinum]
MGNRLLSTLAASVVGAAAATFVLAEPASAECYVAAFKSSTWTEAYPSGCPSNFYAQARIDRLESGVPKIYTGSMGSYSYISATYGTNAGNARRWQATNGNISAWLWTW